MPDLKQLQQQFQDYLLSKPSTIEQSVLSTEKVSAAQRLAIYSDAYQLRLIEALSVNYPILHTLLGDELFDALARQYIQLFPSKYRSIRWYGEQLSDYIRKSFNHIEHQNLVADMALFEWALSIAFDAQDYPFITTDQLTSVPAEHWPSLRFKIQQSLQLINLQSNCVVVWQALNKEQDCPNLITHHAQQVWIIWRKQLQTQFRCLDVHEAWALQTIIQGQDFTAMCDGLTEWIDEQHCAIQAASFLKQWVNDGLISEIC